jgi:hypothetical protein
LLHHDSRPAIFTSGQASHLVYAEGTETDAEDVHCSEGSDLQESNGEQTASTSLVDMHRGHVCSTSTHARVFAYVPQFCPPVAVVITVSIDFIRIVAVRRDNFSK